jgi:hypothetical protein
MSMPPVPCTGTPGYVFRPFIEGDFPTGKRSYQSITASDVARYRGFSFEELRLADYGRVGKLMPWDQPKTSSYSMNLTFSRRSGEITTKPTKESQSVANASPFSSAVIKKETEASQPTTSNTASSQEWMHIENDRDEDIMEVDPVPKPKVVLPAFMKGIINMDAVEQLQENHNKAELELKKLKQSAARDAQAKAEKLRKVENELKMLKQTAEKEKEALGLRMQAQMEKTLETRSEELKKTLAATRAAEIAKLEAKFQDRAGSTNNRLSDAEIRELLASNPLAVSICKANLFKQLEIEKAKITTSLTAEFERKLQGVQDKAATEKAELLLRDGNQLYESLGSTVDQVNRANAKLCMVEKAAETRPNAPVKIIWEEIKQMIFPAPEAVANSAFQFPASDQYGPGATRMAGPLQLADRTRGLTQASPNGFRGASMQPRSYQNSDARGNYRAETMSTGSFLGKRGREPDNVNGPPRGPRQDRMSNWGRQSRWDERR